MSGTPSGVDDQKAITEDAAPRTSTDKEQDKAATEYSQRADNGELSMRVHVHSPYKDYYDGQAFSLTAENATGPFDILPKHHSFISLLLPCELILRTVKEGEQRIRISGGLLHVKSDQVVVFLDV